MLDQWKWRYFAFRHKKQARLNIVFDHEHGVETATEHPLESVGVAPADVARGNGVYRPLTETLFRAAIAACGIDATNFTFYSEFRNKAVAVIGAGASAIEAGALVQEGGGSSEVFVRGQDVVFHGRAPRVRPLWKRIKEPTTVLGTSRSGWVLQHLPLLVYRLPRERRTRFVKGHLGPASPWWIQDRVLGKVPIHTRHELVEAGSSGNRVQLKFRNGEDQFRAVDVDFVIAGTGYEVDVARLAYLDQEIIHGIRCIEQSPELNSHFESSVSGLHFLGPLSFMCFGPLFRFVSGAQVAAQRLARHLSQ